MHARAALFLSPACAFLEMIGFVSSITSRTERTFALPQSLAIRQKRAIGKVVHVTSMLENCSCPK
jgi:hypothetical protein